MEANKNRVTQIISWLFLLYFLVLAAERAQSVLRVILLDGTWFATGFDGYVNILTLLSLAATATYLAVGNRDFWRSLVRAETVPDYARLTAAAGLLLFGGMVHTEYTIAPVQFGAYGALIAAMGLRTFQVAPGAGRAKSWYSFAYLTVFSMAIPVMYRSGIPHAWLFHIVEAATAAVLAAMFGYMLLLLFSGRGIETLHWAPFTVMAVCDAVILAMRRSEEVNTFVLIFASLTVPLFIAGRLIFRR